MSSNIRGFALIPLLMVFLILSIAVLFLPKPRNVTPENIALKPPSEIDLGEKDTNVDVEERSKNQTFKELTLDIYEIKKKLVDIVVNDIDENEYSWNNGDEVYIKVYKNTDGPTIFQESYEVRKWTYNLDREIEIINNLKIGENLVKDDSINFGEYEYYYFADYRKIGNRKYLVKYHEFHPAATVGRNYKFIDKNNDNLISVKILFLDLELRKYMRRNAEYYKEYKNDKFGDFPQAYNDFFQRFEDEVLKDL